MEMDSGSRWADIDPGHETPFSEIVLEEQRRKENQQVEVITETIRRTHGLGHSAPHRLYCNRETIQSIPSIDIPDMAQFVTIEKLDEVYSWGLSLPQEFEEHMSTTTLSKIIPRKELSKMRHEFVAEAFQLGETDATLTQYFDPVDDGQDILTPDFMFKDEYGVVHVIEIATTRAVDFGQITKIVDDKLFKYENALFLRSSQKPATLSVVVINQQGVFSNIPLSMMLVDDLCIRYSVMIGLENVAKSKGISIFLSAREEELSEIALQIQDSITSIGVDDRVKDDSVSITAAFINECLAPVNHDMVLEAFATSFKENPANIGREWEHTDDGTAGKDHRTKKLDGIRGHLEDYRGKFKENEDQRTTKLKSILNVPNIVPQRTPPSTLVQFKNLGTSKTERTLVDIWKEAFSGINSSSDWKEMGKQDLLNEAMETRQDKLAEIKQKRKIRMKTRARVAVKLNPGSIRSLYLAKDGIKGKHTKNESWRRNRKFEQSKSCHYHTSTQDVDDFLNSKEFYAPHNRGESHSQEAIDKLITSANDIAMNSDKGMEIVRDWEKTVLYEYAEFISDLSTELTVTLRQHTKRNELLLKKMRNYNCYLLLSPSGLKNPIGVSIMVPKTQDTILLRNFIGRELVETSTCYITKFVTFAPDKLENLYNLPSIVISLVSFLSYFYDVREPTVENCMEAIEFKKMLNFLLAIRLEDKAETEESMTQTRYMYMEAMRTSAPIVQPEPLKVLSKLTTMPRSRLNLWVIKRIVQTFSEMTENLPRRVTVNDMVKDSEDEDPLPTDNWLGLINFITGMEVQSASKLLNLFYMGYLKNKNASAQGNTNWALLEKTLKEEISVQWKERDSISGHAPVDKVPGSHQFNVECIKAGVETLENRLAQIYGGEWKEVIGDRVLKMLSLHSSFSMATLKASSTTTDADVKTRMTKANNKPVKRRKVLSAIIDNIKLYGINPFSKLHKFIRIREKGSKKARTDLFKKQQHGGLREIFVMDEITRPIQLFLETTSRVICSEFEEESLTNPRKKLPIINNHFRKSKRYSAKTERNSVNYNSSMDKTRWSQGFVIRAMSVALFRLTPHKFHGAIQKALNMWVGKHVKIPPEVIGMLLNDVRLSSKAYQRLHAEFHGLKKFGDGERPILEGPRSGFVSLQTGFMQGILHYTSSLLHLAFLSLSKAMIQKTVNSLMPGCDILISYACSSDDSAIMTTLFYPPDSRLIDKKWVMYADTIEKLLHTLEIFCKFYCMRPSTKSTVAMLDSVEFNSEFIFNNTLAVPIIKFIAASQNIVPYESFLDKLQGHYNLLSDLYASGLPSFNTHLCQIAQAINHYKSIGIGLSPLDGELSNRLLKVVEPGYGFFPMDSELCPGVMGFPFTQYLVCKSTGQIPISPKSIRKEPLTITENGSVSESLQVLHGDRRKQKKLLLDIYDKKHNIKRSAKEKADAENYNKTLDTVLRVTRDEVDRNYELFYRAAKTDDDLYLKIELKVLMPGVAKSLMSSNVFVQTVSVSLYSCHTDCITITTERVVPELRSTNGSKCRVEKSSKMKLSLLAALKVKEGELDASNSDSRENEKLLSVCFPLIVRYEEAIKVINSYSNRVEVEVARMRSQKNRMDIIPVRGRLPLTLLETVKAVWFGHSVRTSKTVLRRCYEIYSAQYTWLREDHNSTLEESPFGTASEMFGFLNSAGESMRTFVPISPSINSTKMTSQLSKLIMKNYKCCTVLRRPDEKKELNHHRGNLKNELDLALLIPIREIREARVGEILNGPSIINSGSLDPCSLNKRDLSLHLIQGYYRGELDNLYIGEIISNTRIGYQIFYLKEQTRQVGSDGVVRWVGDGEVLLHMGKDAIILRLKDDKLAAIHATDLASIGRNLHMIRNALEELSVRPLMDRTTNQAMMGKYNGDRIINKSAAGCPIFKDKDTERIIGDLRDMQVGTSKGIINLTHKAGECNRSTLVKYQVRNSDIDTSSNRKRLSDFWQAWVKSEPWDFSKFWRTLGDMRSQIETMDKALGNWRVKETARVQYRETRDSLEEYREFMAMTLRYRLGQRKSLKINPDDYLSTIGDAKYDEPLEYMDEDMLNELMMETYGLEVDEEGGYDTIESEVSTRFNDVIKLKIEEVDELEDAMEHLDMMTDANLNSMSKLISDRLGDTPLASILNRKMAIEYKGDSTELMHRPSNVYSNHPLWDDLINTIDTRDKKMLNNIMNGIVIGYDKELSRLLLWLLNIDEKTVTDRLQMPDLEYEDPTLRKVREFLEKMRDYSSSEED